MSNPTTQEQRIEFYELAKLKEICLDNTKHDDIYTYCLDIRCGQNCPLGLECVALWGEEAAPDHRDNDEEILKELYPEDFV